LKASASFSLDIDLVGTGVALVLSEQVGQQQLTTLVFHQGGWKWLKIMQQKKQRQRRQAGLGAGGRGDLGSVILD
jgi:hypothetical protein